MKAVFLMFFGFVLFCIGCQSNLTPLERLENEGYTVVEFSANHYIDYEFDQTKIDKGYLVYDDHDDLVAIIAMYSSVAALEAHLAESEITLAQMAHRISENYMILTSSTVVRDIFQGTN